MLPRRASPEPKIDATNVVVFMKRGTKQVLDALDVERQVRGRLTAIAMQIQCCLEYPGTGYVQDICIPGQISGISALIPIGIDYAFPQS